MSATAAGDDLAHFVDKWLAHCPHWRIGQVFLPVARREAGLAWLALLFELREPLFAPSDLSIRRAKGAWWAEELLGMARGAARHPLARRLHREAGGWEAMALALAPLLDDPDPEANVAAALDRVMPLAEAAAGIEARILGPAVRGGAAALARHWLVREWQRAHASGDLARLPMTIRARHALRGEPAAAQRAEVLADWAAHLRAGLPEPGGTYARRFETAWDERLLSRPSGTPMPPWRALWPAWRSARSVAEA